MTWPWNRYSTTEKINDLIPSRLNPFDGYRRRERIKIFPFAIPPTALCPLDFRSARFTQQYGDLLRLLADDIHRKHHSGGPALTMHSRRVGLLHTAPSFVDSPHG